MGTVIWDPGISHDAWLYYMRTKMALCTAEEIRQWVLEISRQRKVKEAKMSATRRGPRALNDT